MPAPWKLVLIGGEITVLAAFTGIGLHLAMQPHRHALVPPPSLLLPVPPPPAPRPLRAGQGCRPPAGGDACFIGPECRLDQPAWPP